MKITMEFSELNDTLQRFVQVGFMEAVRAYEPAQDMLKQKDVKGWLKMMHIDEGTFKALVKNKSVRARRKGTAVNSPLYYSKREIKQALATVGLLKVINKYDDIS